MVRLAVIADADAMAALHAQAFPHAWPAGDLAALLASGAQGWIADDGFILVRQAAGEAEVLTLAVAPEARRRGLGRLLVAAAVAELGEVELFLEVAADNEAALALYASAGFQSVGVRKGYYARANGAVDALTLKLGAPA